MVPTRDFRATRQSISFFIINEIRSRNKSSRGGLLLLNAEQLRDIDTEEDFMSTTKRTTDLKTIRRWAEDRDGRPARVADTADGGGILRIDFQQPDEGLEEISWDTFFDIFQKRDLDFLYQERMDDGSVSRFHKFVSREER